MPPIIALTAGLIFILWILRRDLKERKGLSRALWLPTIWMAVISSRPVSTWFGQDLLVYTVDDYLRGSAIDRTVFLTLILGSLMVLFKRRVQWGAIIRANKAVFALYLFLCISVLWAYAPFISFKRWFKDFGNIVMVLVMLTEKNPKEAFKAVFIRCAYILVPLSLVFLRYYPALGRVYNTHSGIMMATGVTFQKNSLGVMVLVCCLPLFWDLLDVFLAKKKPTRTDLAIRAIVLAIGAWLLILSDSKTSIVCAMVGSGILVVSHMKNGLNRARHLSIGSVVAGSLLLLLRTHLNVTADAVQKLGRDMTFTGRTEVWRELLKLDIDPLIGTGFCSFWSDWRYQRLLPDWVAFSAHNGYVEMYIDGGMIGVTLTLLMLIVGLARANKHMAAGDHNATIRMAFIVGAALYNCFESAFGRLNPIWFVLLLVILELPRAKPVSAPN